MRTSTRCTPALVASRCRRLVPPDRSTDKDLDDCHSEGRADFSMRRAPARGENAVLHTTGANAQIRNRCVTECDTPQENPIKQRGAMRNTSCSANSRMVPARHHGFSLIELLIVVALVAVLAGMSVPATLGR